MSAGASVDVVIARYSEDLDWVGEIPAGFQVVIYNKGAEIASAPARRRADAIVQLRNGGREGDTILRHVLESPPRVDGCTVFLQGDPFEHSPDMLRLLQAHEAWADLQPMSWRWIAAEGLPPPDVLARETAGFVAGARVRAELFSLVTWGPLQFADPGARRICDDYRRVQSLPGGVNMAAHFLRRCEWPELAEQAARHLVGRFSYGALFAASNARLALAPRRSLELALEAVNSHQMYGYVLERLWLHMFGEPFLLPAPAPDRTPEDVSALSPRFAPQPVAVKQPLLRRLGPALKRRVAAWAQA